ncbi:protein slender lobes [Sabethes cyaneus]|uniref:protein slender lobes n=1 Tax=Sabethes cyaneus TaxID=53552 RepID=UPI00237D817C|nr:protein slender lobes [Sabethes cyaneus]
MNQEEETSTRVTRGALRRRSIDQDTSAGTPKKTVTKKATVLNTIQEKDTSSDTPVKDQNASIDESIKNQRDTPAASKASVSRLRSRTTSLTEENLATWDELQETRRTPRRRPSQDVTPQTAPQSNRRITRRNSATSEDALITTPIASRSRLSVAPPTIAEDDEKEDKINSSNTEAELSDLDVRKLRNRSISNSPVPRTSPSLKNTSQTLAEEILSTPKQAKVVLTDIGEKQSPLKSPTSDLNISSKSVENNESLVNQSSASIQFDHANGETAVNGKQPEKNVTFDEKTTLEWQNPSAYPKTPKASGERKTSRFTGRSVEASPQPQDSSKVTPEMFDIAETDSDSPSKPNSTTVETKPVSVLVVQDSPQVHSTEPAPEHAGEQQQLDRSMDVSLANIVENVRENLNQADHSMSMLDTPRPVDKQKSRLTREMPCSTPLLTVTESATENNEETVAEVGVSKENVEPDNSNLSKSWSKAVKGSTTDKGIDVFSVRKQEEEERKDEEIRELNESLKRKSLDGRTKDEEEIEQNEEDDCSDAEEHEDQNSFVENEAIEVNDYHSGDSLDSETRAEIDENAIVEEGESIGSQDSDDDEDGEGEEDEKDSFIVSDEDEHSLLEVSGDDLADESAKSIKKKRSRILQQEDSSDEDNDSNKMDEPENGLPTASPERSNNVSVSASKSPGKSPIKTATQSPIKSAGEHNSPQKKRKEIENTDGLSKKEAGFKSRKSMPVAKLISADFYVSSPKKNKRNTINVMTSEESELADKPVQKPNKRKSVNDIVANPAALALAKKNKRHTLDATSNNATSKSDKRVSLPGNLSVEKELTFLQEEQRSLVEPMEVDEDPIEEQQPDENAEPIKEIKKKPKDLSEFDHDAILSRCNEIVRADKERKKQTATLRQKKKDEKRRQREQQQLEESTEANDESLEQSRKKKKKKKKQINYLLEELGEPKEDQLAKALQRRAALLEAKKLRKKAKKAAKLKQQLNKENQQNEKPKPSGIGAKFEKKAKKNNDLTDKAISLASNSIPAEPKVKILISAHAFYSEQIEELKNEQKFGKKKNKQLKEKNNQQSAAEEAQKALDAKIKKGPKCTESKDPETQITAQASNEKASSNRSDKKPKDKKKSKHAENSPQKNIAEEPTNIKRRADSMNKSIEQAHHSKETQHKRTISDVMKVPVDLDDDLAQLRVSLSEPIGKVVKKQKLSQKESVPVQQISVEKTPPRKTTNGQKLKMLSRLESGGFVEEPMTPEQQLLKRNLGFKEEPVTPKPIGFRVSSILPAGQEEMRSQAVAAKKLKKHSQSHRIRPDNVTEPVKTLPLPVWTRSGSFEVEDVGNIKKKSTARKPCIPLKTGSSKVATEFMVQPLQPVRQADSDSRKKLPPRQIEQIDAKQAMYDFKKQAILAKNAHLREKKPKH